MHDGELADVRELLESVDPEFVDRRGAPLLSDEQQRWALVIATPQRMLELRPAAGATKRIAILDGDSRTLRSILRREGIEFLVPRPVHPAALRLLVLHTLYRGPEKRRIARVSVGGAIRYRAGLWSREAVLADVSVTGCRILSSHPAKPGRTLRIQFPARLTGAKALSLRGTALRCSAARDATAGTHAIAVAWKGPQGESAVRLKALVSRYASGPATHRGSAVGAAAATPTPKNDTTEPAQPRSTDETSAAVDESASAGGERRRAERHTFERRVIALDDEATRVLLGRDISVGGMRIDPNPSLGVGDEIRLAIHVRARKVPLVVTARVDRDDGDTGMVLRFHDLTDSATEYLEKMVNLLPVLASRDGAEAGVIVSEILEQESPAAPSRA